jgi:mono/diheme cytochrome c family protein
MRERIALLICWLTVVLVAGLSWLFAVRHNPAGAPAAPVAPRAVLPAVAAYEDGARVFREQSCTSCHALGGAGNPRHGLDGVGARLNREELRMWTTGTGAAADKLSPMVARRKLRYQELPEAEMSALLDYLAAAGGPRR